jgi:AcrR family transcriptional regulator
VARQKDESKIPVIFQAALKVVLATGYSGLKMSAVAKAAGMATGTLYIYFTNKKDLINQLFLKLKAEKTKEMLRGYDPAESFFLSFRKLWFNYILASMAEPERMIFIEQYARSPCLTEETQRKADAMLAPLLDFLNQARRQHLIKPVDPSLMLNYLMGAANELIKLHLEGRLRLCEEQLEACFEMAWHGIRK